MSVWQPALAAAQPGHASRRPGGGREARGLEAATPREQDYIAAIATLLQATPTSSISATRAVAYEKAMEQVVTCDTRTTARRRSSTRSRSTATALADRQDLRQSAEGRRRSSSRLFAEQPDHPGLAHYIIHSLRRPAAGRRRRSPPRARYAKIAPAAPHALHMPSHTFTRVGLLAGVDRHQPRLGRRRRHSASSAAVCERAARDGLPGLRLPADRRRTGGAGARCLAEQSQRFDRRAAEPRRLRRPASSRGGDPGALRARARRLERGGRAHCAPRSVRPVP